MADWIFNGVSKIIWEPTGSGNTTFDVSADIYSAWKRWVISGSGAPFPAAFSVEGGTPIGATGFYTGTTYILVNGWKLRAANHDHQVTLNGNLYSDDGIVSVANATNNTTIFVNSSVSAQGVATSAVQQQTLEAIQALVNDIHLIHGLAVGSPLLVSTSSRSAGEVTQSIGTSGGTTIVIRV